MRRPITYMFKKNLKDDLWENVVDKSGKVATVTTDKGEWAAYYWFKKHFTATAERYIFQQTLKAVPIRDARSRETEWETCPECGEPMTMKYCQNCEEGNRDGM